MGRYGRSAVAIKQLGDGSVIKLRRLPDRDFAEGLARVDGRWVQLTWREKRVYLYDDDLKPLATLPFPYEGWGAASLDGGTRLITSDGSATLRVFAPDFSAVERSFTVRGSNGDEVTNLNELEAIGPYLLANIWKSDRVMIIDTRPESAGKVVAELDFSSLSERLRKEAPALDPEGVLNGLAWDAQAGQLLVTGKLWPRLYAVEIKNAPWHTGR